MNPISFANVARFCPFFSSWFIVLFITSIYSFGQSHNISSLQPNSKGVLTQCKAPENSNDPQFNPTAYQRYERAFLENRSIRALQGPIQIPIKAHIIRRDNGSGGLEVGTLENELEVVNALYKNANLSFFLCNGINYIDDNKYYDFKTEDQSELYNGFGQQNVVNIFFANSVSDENGAYCGYAYFPWSNLDLIMMDNQCTSNGATLAHELGHYFGLYHTHGKTNSGDTDELVDGSNCEYGGDNLCDTPADPRLNKSGAMDGCTYIGTETDANGESYTPDPSNIMSYAPKYCKDYFSPQQYARIAYYHSLYKTYLACGASEDKPDYRPFEVSVSPSTVNAGQQITASVRVKNRGAGDANESAEGHWYFSADDELDLTLDTYLGFTEIPPLKAGNLADFSETLTIPNSANTGGIYYLMFLADGTDRLEEELETNNRAFSTLTLNEGIGDKPDYAAQNMQVSPGSAASGEQVDLQVKVKNIGIKDADLNSEGHWYFSENPFLEPNTDTFLGKTTISPIKSQKSKTFSFSTTLPNSATPGSTYYFIFFANATDEFSEVPGENNTDNVAITIKDGVSSQVDFVPSNMSVTPPKSAPRDSVDVTVTVSNVGGKNANQATEGRWYFSEDENLNTSSDRFLGFTNVSALQAGASIEYTKRVKVPNFSVKGQTYFIIFAADAAADITEFSEENNTDNVRITIKTNQEIPDYASQNIQSSPERPDPGQQILASGTIKNVGGGDVSVVSEAHWYLSADKEFNTDGDTYLGNNTVAPLSIGESAEYTATLNLPHSLNRGTSYYLFLFSDATNVISEVSRTNNWEFAEIFISEEKPDLIAKNLTASSTLVSPNDLINVSVGIENLGPGDSEIQAQGSWYLSLDNLLDPEEDEFMGNSSIAPLVKGNSLNLTQSLSIPENATLGTDHYLIFVVDSPGDILEGNEGNNIASLPIKTKTEGQITDYSVENVQASPTLVGMGKDVALSVGVKNMGGEKPGAACEGHWYFSSDEILQTGEDVFLGKSIIDPLEPGQLQNFEQTFSLPETVSVGESYYFIFYADATNEIYEVLGTNNIASVGITVIEEKPDYVPGKLSISPNPIFPGDLISAIVEIQNIGKENPEKNVQGAWYFSEDPSLDIQTDIQLALVDIPSLEPGQAQTLSASLTIPQAAMRGTTYHLIFWCDANGEIEEEDENNNDLSIPFDIVPSIAPIAKFTTSPDSGFAPLTVTFDASASNDPDGGVLTFDWEFGEGGSASGKMVSHTFINPGAYQVQLTITDDEGDTAVAIQKIKALEVPMPDLIAESHEVSTSSKIKGVAVTLKVKVLNIGNAVAKASKLGFYFSQDNSLDGGDLFLNAADIPQLSENQEFIVQFSFDISDTYEPGSYYIFLAADDEDIVPEKNEGNNITEVRIDIEETKGPFAFIPTTSSGAFYGQAQVEGVSATNEDWIAAFDEDGNCAGANPINSSQGIGYINLVIYGDDPTTSSDEGINGNESFRLVLYDASADAYLDYPVPGIPTFYTGWQNLNGAPIPDFSDPTRVYNFLLESTRTDKIKLHKGWNLISLDVEPFEEGIQEAFSSLSSGNLQYVTSFDGGSLLFDPNSPSFLNTLTTLEKGLGYWVKVKENDSLIVEGIPLDPNFRRSLTPGWNLVAYLSQQAQSPKTYYSALIAKDELAYVTGFEQGSKFYDPIGIDLFNTLKELKNGFGYWVKIKDQNRQNSLKGQVQPNPMAMFVNGKLSHPEPALIGEYISILDENGLVHGKMEILPEGYLSTLPLYGQDPSNQENLGLKEGQLLSLMYKGKILGEKIQYTEQRTHSFVTLSSPLTHLAKIYPNPSHGAFTLEYELGTSGLVELFLINALGQNVAYQRFTSSIGEQKLLWEQKSIPEGIYSLQIVSNGNLLSTQRVVITGK